MKTVVVNQKSIEHKWYVVDANEMVLGRLASTVATILTGKNKPAFSPNQDHGDHVVIINADKVVLTGKKADTKEYFRHSKYPGGEKFRSFKEQMALDSTEVVKHAVKGMLNKGPLGRAIFKKLHVYKDHNHRHEAQKPEPLSI